MMQFIFSLLLLASTAFADFDVDMAVKEKILSQGVPAASLNRIVDWMAGKHGTSFSQRVYTCRNQDPENLRPCGMDERTHFFKTVNISPHRYAVSIDFGLPSTDRRFYFIDLVTGEVQKHYVTHGKGSGALRAEKFSNILDSNMTSLGIYLVGEIYVGYHGESLRMYGLESTNDNSYDRDIVFHGADYADPKFITKINPNTDLPYGRLGVSKGCPAITNELMAKYLPFLRDGGVVDHYHSGFIF